MNLSQHLSKEEIIVSENKLLKLERFADLLHEWNQIHNLTGAKTIEKIYENIVDSIYPISFISSPKSLLDVGTGAGFPGMILAIVYPDSEVVLCEPLNKRVSFLKYASMELEAKNISVAKMRVENLTHSPFTMISSRAVTDTKLLLDITAHLSDERTQYLFYKGSQVFGEIDSFDNQLNYDIVQRDKRNYLWIKK
jgi:16S rRNA (guanine527-N7)-methyltransferase